jgi:chloramphenicol-sensitive protein RarD
VQHNHRLGVTAALAAFGFWGMVPIYFKQLSAVPALEIIAHRVLWAIPVLVLILLLRDGRDFSRRLVLPRKAVLTLLLSGSLVSTNWLIFVWAFA